MQTVTESPTEVQSDRSKLIQSYASRMAARHPQHATLADKAAAIVERGGVHVISYIQIEVEGDTGTYDVQLQPDGRIVGCTCPAFYYRPAVINGRHFCKHIVAWLIYVNVAEVGNGR